MFESINAAFMEGKRRRKDHALIIEAVLGEDESIPGAEDDDFSDTTDVDSVPEDVYKKIDSMLDKIVERKDYDDAEAEELLDDDFDEDDDEIEIDEADLDAAMSED